MVRFERLKKQKIEELRYVEGQQMKEQMVGRSKSNERSASSLLYERLHSEELRKGRRTSEKKLVKSATTKTTTTRVETVVQHLYTDHFTREQKLHQLRTAVEKESQKRVDYSRTNQYIASKIDQEVRDNLAKMDLREQHYDYHGYVLNFFQMLEFMAELRYCPVNSIEDEVFNNLLNSMWHILTLSQDFHEPGVTERNLCTFLKALENVTVSKMIYAYPTAAKETRDFGLILEGTFYFSSEQEIAALHKAFSAFYDHKHSAR